MTIREEMERQEHLQLAPNAAFSDESKGRLRPEEAEELAQKAQKVLDMENGILEKILTEGTYIRPWVDEKLKALGCQID